MCKCMYLVSRGEKATVNIVMYQGVGGVTNNSTRFGLDTGFIH
jgi:hypothetical protein